MLRRLEVLAGMLVFRAVAAPGVTARQAFSDLDPFVPRLFAVFAALGVGLDGHGDLVQMDAFRGHDVGLPLAA